MKFYSKSFFFLNFILSNLSSIFSHTQGAKSLTKEDIERVFSLYDRVSYKILFITITSLNIRTYVSMDNSVNKCHMNIQKAHYIRF